MELSELPASFRAHARRARKEKLLLTSRGKPVAALVPVVEHDAESVALKENPQFLAILERSQASYEQHGGYTTEEVRRLLGVRRRKPSKKRTPSRSRRPQRKR